jgi:hypothetical protein
MEEQIKIGFTGNRYGLNDEQKEQIVYLLDKYNNIIVSHGDCIGSDTEFHDICVNYRNININKQIRIDIYPPNISKLRGFNKGDIIMNEKPYLQRNSDIINNSSILIACPIDKNKEEIRSGTWSTIRKAKKQKLEIYIF